MSLRRKNSSATLGSSSSSSSSSIIAPSDSPRSGSGNSSDELSRLIESNDATGVRRHLKKHAADVNATLDARGGTPLMLAARTIRGDVAMLRVLLRSDRIVVNARDSGGNTALHWLVRSLTTGTIVVEALDVMAQHRADFAAVNAKHETILHVAVGNLAVPSLTVAVLERNCVEIGARTSPASLTALHYAIAAQNLYAIDQLLAAGALVENASRGVDMYKAAASVLGGSERIVPQLRMNEAVQERIASSSNLASFYHTQRLPEKWTVVPDSLSIMPDRDALLLDIVNTEIEHAYNVAMLGQRYAMLLQTALGAREMRSILTSLPQVHVVTRRLASALASGKYTPGEVFARLLPDISASYEEVCASQQRSTSILRRACKRSKEFADALAARAVGSRGAGDDTLSLFSMLNLPTLRLFKHKQQLQALLSWTPTTMNEHTHLTVAVAGYADLFKRINQLARRFARNDLAHDLGARFGVPVSHDAELLCSGPVRLHDKRWRAAHLHVLSERIILCDVSSKKAKLVASYDIRACSLPELSPDAAAVDREPATRVFIIACTFQGAVVRHHIAAHIDDSDKSQIKTDVQSRAQWVWRVQRAIDEAQERATRVPAKASRASSRTISRDAPRSPVASRPSSRTFVEPATPAPAAPAPATTTAVDTDDNAGDEGTAAMPHTVGSGATTEEIALLSANAHRMENAFVLPEDAETAPRPSAAAAAAAAAVPHAAFPDDYVIVNPTSIRQRAMSNNADALPTKISVDVRSGMRELASALNDPSPAMYAPIAATYDTYVSNASDIASLSDDDDDEDNNNNDDDDDTSDEVVIHGGDAVVLVQGDVLDIPEPPTFGSSDDTPPELPVSPPPDTPPSPDEPPPPPPTSSVYDQAPLKRANKHPCIVCARSVTGEAVKALGGVWHRECFRCAHCGVQLSSAFVEFDSQPYCKSDFVQLFAPRCAACKEPIAERVVRAPPDSYHEECFACSICNVSLSNKPYCDVNGRPMCELCGSRPTSVAPAKPKRK